MVETVTDDLPVDTRFGSFLAKAGAVVTLPDGMPGFERCRRFVIVTGPTLEPFHCLQGLDEDKPSFLTLDPKTVVPDYASSLSDAARSRLEAAPGDALLWMAVVRLDDRHALVNLRAPIVVNPRRMLGVQLVESESPYTTEHVLPLD